MRKFLFCSSLLIVFIHASSQTPTDVRIKVKNSAGAALASATISVFAIPDTTNMQQKISDSAGVAVFQLQLRQPYRLRITSVSFQTIEKNITVQEEHSSFSFTAEPISKSLTSVVVTANRPVMRQEDDKTIVDPENLALSSTNAYEIVEKTPGLYVDQDGNIYLSSTTPAKVYINGREQKMSAMDMATLLKSLPPNAISSIEIMRTPSARYDASGSGA